MNNKDKIKIAGLVVLAGTTIGLYTYLHNATADAKIKTERVRYKTEFNHRDLNKDGVLSLEEYLPERLRE